MADKRKKRSLARESETSQETEKGLAIPTKDEFFGLLKRAARKTTQEG